MFKFLFRLLRLFLIVALGVAAAAKFLLESNAEPDTEEIDLVSIFDGQNLRSTANPFYGGKIMAMFGGVMLDLREATPGPTGIHLDVAVMMGGVSIVVPEGWRVRSRAKVIMAGFDDETHTTAAEDVPTIDVTGMLLFAGLQVTTKSPIEATV